MKSLEDTLEFMPQFEKRGGMIPAIAQDVRDGRILMIGSVNAQALTTALETRRAAFWSTSRNTLWVKGETSGDFLEIEEILVDCDQDAVVYRVRPAGAGACHTKNAAGQARLSCFYRRVVLPPRAGVQPPSTGAPEGSPGPKAEVEDPKLQPGQDSPGRDRVAALGAVTLEILPGME
ncbi:phosphoribosyl-AMP cyclohydrolase [Spirochaeta lutea]|uniref:phosphoribosyl-AMP cyclohydrolase n=1 Tax=Spirochaeta lutea TaxID=1480694 RepID=UPI0009E09F49|nr:phosphoribosyl-AMP cyclohydrolase [Spirochaeta lutea]